MYAQREAGDDAVVGALASHQCGPSSIPGLGVMCGLSLLLVLVLALRGFSPSTPVFSSPRKFQFDLKVSPISALRQIHLTLTLKWSEVGTNISFYQQSEEIRELTFRALALRQSEYEIWELLVS